MTDNSDQKLIKKFIDWCSAGGFNQTEMAMLVKKTKGWSSLIVQGKIKRLQFDTRNRIKGILGIQ